MNDEFDMNQNHCIDTCRVMCVNKIKMKRREKERALNIFLSILGTLPSQKTAVMTAECRLREKTR